MLAERAVYIGSRPIRKFVSANEATEHFDAVERGSHFVRDSLIPVVTHSPTSAANSDTSLGW